MSVSNFEKEQISNIIQDLRTRVRDFDTQGIVLQAQRAEVFHLLNRLEKLQSDIEKADAAVKARDTALKAGGV